MGLDPLAITYPDPDHSSLLTASVEKALGSLVRALLREPNKDSMKKESAAKRGNDMRKEYDLSKVPGGVRGKYYRRATAGTNLVLIEPDLATMFPDSKAVNRALRVLAEAAQTAGPAKPQPSR
jgi:hypothetical protein